LHTALQHHRVRGRSMSQGKVMELDDRIKAELRRLRASLPRQFQHVQSRLRGWEEDLDDYWIEVTRGNQNWRVETGDDWRAVRSALQAALERPSETLSSASAQQSGGIAPIARGQNASAVSRGHQPPIDPASWRRFARPSMLANIRRELEWWIRE